MKRRIIAWLMVFALMFSSNIGTSFAVAESYNDNGQGTKAIIEEPNLVLECAFFNNRNMVVPGAELGLWTWLRNEEGDGFDNYTLECSTVFSTKDVTFEYNPEDSRLATVKIAENAVCKEHLIKIDAIMDGQIVASSYMTIIVSDGFYWGYNYYDEWSYYSGVEVPCSLDLFYYDSDNPYGVSVNYQVAFEWDLDEYDFMLRNYGFDWEYASGGDMIKWGEKIDVASEYMSNRLYYGLLNMKSHMDSPELLDIIYYVDGEEVYRTTQEINLLKVWGFYEFDRDVVFSDEQNFSVIYSDDLLNSENPSGYDESRKFSVGCVDRNSGIMYREFNSEAYDIDGNEIILHPDKINDYFDKWENKEFVIRCEVTINNVVNAVNDVTFEIRDSEFHLDFYPNDTYIIGYECLNVDESELEISIANAEFPYGYTKYGKVTDVYLKGDTEAFSIERKENVWEIIPEKIGESVLVIVLDCEGESVSFEYNISAVGSRYEVEYIMESDHRLISGQSCEARVDIYYCSFDGDRYTRTLADDVYVEWQIRNNNPTVSIIPDKLDSKKAVIKADFVEYEKDNTLAILVYKPVPGDKPILVYENYYCLSVCTEDYVIMPRPSEINVNPGENYVLTPNVYLFNEEYPEGHCDTDSVFFALDYDTDDVLIYDQYGQLIQPLRNGAKSYVPAGTELTVSPQNEAISSVYVAAYRYIDNQDDYWYMTDLFYEFDFIEKKIMFDNLRYDNGTCVYANEYGYWVHPYIEGIDRGFDYEIEAYYYDNNNNKVELSSDACYVDRYGDIIINGEHVAEVAPIGTYFVVHVNAYNGGTANHGQPIAEEDLVVELCDAFSSYYEYDLYLNEVSLPGESMWIPTTISGRYYSLDTPWGDDREFSIVNVEIVNGIADDGSEAFGFERVEGNEFGYINALEYGWSKVIFTVELPDGSTDTFDREIKCDSIVKNFWAEYSNRDGNLLAGRPEVITGSGCQHFIDSDGEDIYEDIDFSRIELLVLEGNSEMVNFKKIDKSSYEVSFDPSKYDGENSNVLIQVVFYQNVDGVEEAIGDSWVYVFCVEEYMAVVPELFDEQFYVGDEHKFTPDCLFYSSNEVDGVSTPGFMQLSWNPDVVEIKNAKGEVLNPYNMYTFEPGSETFTATLLRPEDSEIIIMYSGDSEFEYPLTRNLNVEAGCYDISIEGADGWYCEATPDDTIVLKPVENNGRDISKASINYHLYAYNEEGDRVGIIEGYSVDNNKQITLDFSVLSKLQEVTGNSGIFYVECELIVGGMCVCSGDVTCVVREKVEPININGASLTMEGQIGVNFFLSIPDVDMSLVDAYICMSYTGDTTEPMEVLLKDGIATDNGYKFTFPVAVKELCDKVSLQAYTANGEVIPLTRGSKRKPVDDNIFKYAVIDYLNDVPVYNSGDTKLVAFAESLVNYGAEAQNYFKHNAGTLTSTADYSKVTSATLKPYDATKSGTAITGLKVRGVSLTLESELIMNVAFASTDDVINKVTFKVNGKEVKAVKQSDGMYKIEVPNIAAKDLDEFYTVEYTDGTNTQVVKCCPLGYAYTVLQGSDEGLKTLVKAMYLYNQAANAYFK